MSDRTLLTMSGNRLGVNNDFNRSEVFDDKVFRTTSSSDLLELEDPNHGDSGESPVIRRPEENYQLSINELLNSTKKIETLNLRNSRSYVDAQEPDYHKLIITQTISDERPPDDVEVSGLILEAIQMRKRYVYTPFKSTPTTNFNINKENLNPTENITEQPFDPFHLEHLPPCESQFEEKDGVFHVFLTQKDKDEGRAITEVNSLRTFMKDLNWFLNVVSSGPCKTICYQRLEILQAKYNLHILLNEVQEMSASKSVPHRDFYNLRKVDTHIHHSAAMNQKHLLKFIKKTLRNNPDDKVIIRDGKELTLKEVFESLQLNTYDLSVNTLDVHADKHIFHRFDKFNLKYNPCGQSRLREIFLKTDNHIKGRYLAELTKELFNDLETSRYQYAEYRLSIYGRKEGEFDNLASWVVDNRLFSKNVRWLIQIPRLYSEFKKINMVDNIAEVFSNVFKPLFEATKDPKSHPKLALFLQQVVGFDCVDDESKPTKRFTRKYPSPREWNYPDNPPYAYYAFYLASNIKVLNHFRESRGMNTFSFRPHAGEAGEIEHLAAAFMVANGIAHGVNLRKSPVLQYLYYLTQIGIAMSPLSNNSLFLNYNRNPLPTFFARGLNVSLSTDDPLQFHYTKEPLIEEYSIAQQVWKFSSSDQCEIVRNSVLQSGFEHGLKIHWIGQNYWIEGTQGNDITKTNVPNIRIHFRWNNLSDELKWIIGNLKETDADTSILTTRLQTRINTLN
eukprot:TRINITY_DN3387_c0_g1_i1.p1 TRINITY_DN3387_c0_g1~~TRINITY_DN3387_c0_g1_i1.p1  ORF type:complete len:753 (+),score=234.64 TRINITY_DN3387_c0_g1_i1:66-2261(+)